MSKAKLSNFHACKYIGRKRRTWSESLGPLLRRRKERTLAPPSAHPVGSLGGNILNGIPTT
jgi:hypothetical protein